MNFKKLLILPLIAFMISCEEPIQVSITDTIEGVKIQPAQAVEIAEPFLAEHATEVWNKKKPLVTHITKYKKWYFVMRTNYPAKTIRYYMQPAVRVDTETGEVSFVEKK